MVTDNLVEMALLGDAIGGDRWACGVKLALLVGVYDGLAQFLKEVVAGG